MQDLWILKCVGKTRKENYSFDLGIVYLLDLLPDFPVVLIPFSFH